MASSFDHTTRREAHLRPGEGYRVEFVDGVRFLWLRTPPYSGNTVGRIWNMLVFGFRVWRGTGWGPIERPDVIVGSSPHLFAALAAERVAARLSVPFVLEVRDLWPQTFVDVDGYSRHHPFVALLERIERYLYRSARDLEDLLPLRPNLRIVKGAYLEPPSVAYPKKADVDRNYVVLAERSLLEGGFTAIATHDERIIRWLRAYAYHHEIPSTAYEFQMLYGVRRDLQQRLADEGACMRVYVPYGTHWYPYFMRRLAERPANLVFFAKALLG